MMTNIKMAALRSVNNASSLLLVAFATIGLGACSIEDGKLIPDSCVTSSDCDSESACGGGVCRTRCEENSDCDGADQCEELSGVDVCVEQVGTTKGGDGDGDGDGDGAGGTPGNGDCEPGIFGTSLFGDACFAE